MHRAHTDLFSVLEGELTVVAASEELRAGAGTWVQLPPDTPHASDEEALDSG